MQHFTRIALLAGVVGALLTACGGGGSDVTFTLMAGSTSGEPVEVEYTIAGETITETVDDGWRLAVDVDDSFDLAVRVENGSGSGDVTCRITENPDEPVDQIASRGLNATGEGAAVCEITGTISGNSMSTSGANYGLTQQEVDDGFEPDFDN